MRREELIFLSGVQRKSQIIREHEAKQNNF